MDVRYVRINIFSYSYVLILFECDHPVLFKGLLIILGVVIVRISYLKNKQFQCC